MALVVSETPNIIVRAPLLRQPLIKLAVEPPIVSEPVAVAAVEETPEEVAPAVAGRRILPFVEPQYWQQFGAQNYNPYSPYGYNPYWGGYGQVRPRRWGPSYWGPRVMVTASPVAPVTDVKQVSNTNVEAVDSAPQVN